LLRGAGDPAVAGETERILNKRRRCCSPLTRGTGVLKIFKPPCQGRCPKGGGFLSRDFGFTR